jgi:aspartate carbamoyltransferase catalytic subunit
MIPYHILNSKQFDKKYLERLFYLTNKIRTLNKSKEGIIYLASLLNHKRAMLYFTQPSTRTFLSFHSACHIIGIKTSEIRDPAVSSERKGESLDDALRTFSSYVDLIIMRSPVAKLCERTASILNESNRPIPIINAGSGPDEHPTQALLDLYTVKKGLGDLSGKTITMVGDLKRGRTVRSLSQLLALYKNITINFVSPKQFAIAGDLRNFLQQQNVNFYESSNFLESLPESDVIYMTRIQDEYDLGNESQRYQTKDYSLRHQHLDLLKKYCMILHPMPRRQELDPRIDFDSRAFYWKQERNGMWIRAALMIDIFERNQAIVSL